MADDGDSPQTGGQTGGLGTQPPAELGTEQGRRIIELLWAPPTATPSRGPKPKIALEEGLKKTIAYFDELLKEGGARS